MLYLAHFRHVPGFDEIDASVLEALPPEIREEAAATPLKTPRLP